MPLLREPISIHDIADAEAFVQATINRSRILLDADERDELVATGLEILFKLARDYKPHIAGHNRNDSRFSGYASMFLPRKLGDAWHRNHPEHRLKAQPDGRRRWEYGDRPISLHALPNPDHIPTTHTHDTTNIHATLTATLTARAHLFGNTPTPEDHQRIQTTAHVGVLLSEGATVKDVAQTLSITTVQVRQHIASLELVAHHFEERAA